MHLPRKSFVCLFVMCLLVGACSGGGSAVAPEAPPEPTEPSVSDFPAFPSGSPPGADESTQQLARELGRGVNFGDMLESPADVNWVLQVREEYIEAARAAGFRTVRLPVRWTYHARPQPPFTIDPEFFLLVDQMIDSLLAAGFNVIVDLHHDRQLNGAQVDAGETAIAADLVDLRFLLIWQQIAEHYATRSPRLLFELLNEPDGRMNATRWNDLQLRALQVVRLTNPERVVLLAPAGSNTVLDSIRLPNDPRIIVTVHHYEPFTFTHQGAEWVQGSDAWLGTTCCDAIQQVQITAPLQRAFTWSQQHGYPVYLGEFGAYRRADMDSRVRYTELVRAEAERQGLSWAYWELASSFGVYDPVANTYRQQLLQALVP